MTLRMETDFVPSTFEKRVVEQTKEDVRQRLAGHNLGGLRIVLKKRPGSSGFAFKFFGAPEIVESAKRLLGIY